MAAHSRDDAIKRLMMADTPMVVERLGRDKFDLSFADTVYGSLLMDARPPTLVGVVRPGTGRAEIRRLLG